MSSKTFFLFTFKINFLARGSPHIHGIMWVDWESMAENETHLNINVLKTTFKKIRLDKSLNNEEIIELERFADTFVTCSNKSPLTDEIVNKVNTHHHTKSCRKYNTTCRFNFPKYPTRKTIISIPARVTYQIEEERQEKIRITTQILKKVKLILEDPTKMEEINSIDKERFEEIHQLNKTLSSLSFLIKESKTNVSINDEELKILKQFDIVKGNKKKLSFDSIKKICEIGITKLDKAKAEELTILEKRLLTVLRSANFSDTENDNELLQMYEDSLSISERGYTIHYKRTTSELFVNTYNEEYLYNWNANLDFQICLDFFSIVTYISNYIAKDESGTTKYIEEMLKQAKGEALIEVMKKVTNCFLSHRQMGPAEAVYRLVPSLKLTYSNIDTIFVGLGKLENRSKFLYKIKDNESNENCLEVEGKEGYYKEKITLLEKYMNRNVTANPCLVYLTFAQFAKRYVKTNNKVSLQNDSMASVLDIKSGNLKLI